MRKILVKSDSGYYFANLDDLMQIVPMYSVTYDDFWHVGVFKSEHDVFIYIEPSEEAKIISYEDAKKLCLKHYNNLTDETKNKIEKIFSLKLDNIT